MTIAQLSDAAYHLVTVPSDEQCVLPKRYRSRPEDCFAVHDDEVFECKNVATPPAAALLSSTLLVVLMVTLTN